MALWFKATFDDKSLLLLLDDTSSIPLLQNELINYNFHCKLYQRGHAVLFGNDQDKGKL